jgi:hypothetical protein
MTGPNRQRDATGQWWVFVLLFAVFLAGGFWFFSRGQSVAGLLAVAFGLVDLVMAVIYLVNSRRTR